MNISRLRRMTGRMTGTLALGIVLATSMSVASVAQAASAPPPPGHNHSMDEPAPAAMAFDLLVVRPLGIAATVLGTGLFIATLPFDIFAKDAPAAPFHQLVVAPARYTFTRPLGATN